MTEVQVPSIELTMTSPRPSRPVPPFTDEYEAFRAEVRSFVEAELRPHATEWEEARSFPNDAVAILAERGYLALKFPAQYGGREDLVADAVFAPVESGYVLDGTKAYVTGWVRADVLVTAVRTGGDGHQGVSLLIVERGPGVSLWGCD
jgi:acyl-CoA dehydrogenase